MTRSFFLITGFVLACPPLITAVKADETPLWQNSSPRAGESIRPVAGMSVRPSGGLILGRLHGTAQSAGNIPSNAYALTSLSDQRLNLIVGAQQIPTFELAGLGGAMAGTSMTFGSVTIGSNYRPPGFEQAFLASDPGTAGMAQADVPMDESHMTWIVARPFQSKAGSLNLLMVRGTRDMTPAQRNGKQFLDGNQWGARGEANLPAQWKMRSEWMQSRLATQKLTATAWKLGLDGPIRHPWGVARAIVNYNNTGAGFATLANPTPALGSRNGDASLQQDLAIGPVSGSLGAGFVHNERTDLAGMAAGTELETGRLQTTANLRWKISPSLAMIAAQSYTSSSQKLMGDAASATTGTTNFSTVNTGDVGLEMQMTHSLALTLSGGQTQTDSDALTGGSADRKATVRANEDRVALGLNRHTTKGLWGVQCTHHTFSDRVLNGEKTSADSIQLQAERQLLPILRVKGTYLWTANDSLLQQLRTNRATRSAEAQLAVPAVGRFNLRYSDWAGCDTAATTGISLTGAREYGLSFNVGSADTGTGLGLAVEYALQDVQVGADTGIWRVGVMFK